MTTHDRALRSPPLLAGVAAEAADARIHRKHVGKQLTIIGFSILMVGNIIGGEILFTTPGYPKWTGHETRIFLGAAIALGGQAAGFAVAIPGIVKLASTSAAENRALELYAPESRGHASTRGMWPEAVPRHRQAGSTFVAPLLTLAF